MVLNRRNGEPYYRPLGETTIQASNTTRKLASGKFLQISDIAIRDRKMGPSTQQEVAIPFSDNKAKTRPGSKNSTKSSKPKLKNTRFHPQRSKIKLLIFGT